MADEDEQTNRPPLGAAPIFVSSLMVNGRVVLDANDVIAMLLTRGKESNSLEAEQLCWAMAQWTQTLVFGTVQNALGPGDAAPGTAPSEPPADGDSEPAEPPEGPPTPTA